MLVLSRKPGESIIIGDNVRLVITKTAGNRVTIGIDAPANVPIRRGELAEEQRLALSVLSPVGPTLQAAS